MAEGIARAIRTRLTFRTVLVNSAFSFFAICSESVGSKAVPIAVPINVSGTCRIIHPYVRAVTDPSGKCEARLSRAMNVS